MVVLDEEEMFLIGVIGYGRFQVVGIGTGLLKKEKNTNIWNSFTYTILCSRENFRSVHTMQSDNVYIKWVR